MKNPRRPRDTAELAKQIVDIATGKREKDGPVENEGAAKRGRARAEALTPKQRKAIAKKAAAARWGRTKEK
jgi:hypothetical protein